MEKLFLTVLNLSITASYLVAAVIAARWLLRKTPKSIVCYLWLLVGIRLICPFSVESAFSLLPKEPAFDNRQIFWNSQNDNDTANLYNMYNKNNDTDASSVIADNSPIDGVYSEGMNPKNFYAGGTNANGLDSSDKYSLNQDNINQGNTNQDNTNQGSISQDSMNQDKTNQDKTNQAGIKQSNFIQAVTMFLPQIYRITAYFWLAGMVVMLVYFVVSWRRVRNRVRTAIPMDLEGIKYYQCDNISSPFLFGIMKPRIYVPSHIVQQELSYVLRHEIAHRQRRDYMVKPISYLLLTVYWINPILWAAYILFCRDIELACDEQVVKEMGTDCKKAYSQALLTYSVSRSSIAACPIAFGEIGVKQRVKNILNYKKPTFWVVLVAAAAGIIITVCFMTKPKLQDTTDKNIAENTDNYNENFATAENEKQDFSNNNKNISNAEFSKITENNKITEMVDIRESEIFHLSIPRDLADLLSFEALSDFALSIKSADKQAIIGIMCVIQAEDIKDALNNNEYYLIGTYGANNMLAFGKTADGELSDRIIHQENLELNLPDDIIRQEGLDIEEGIEGIIRPDETQETDEKGGVLPIPNADGTQKPEKLPNSDGAFTAGVIGEIKKGSENNGSDNANSSNINRFPNNFCYIFIPAKQTTWQAEKAQELQLLQDKVISLLESVKISEVGQLVKYQNITVNYFSESEKAALEKEREKLESQIASGTESEKTALEEQLAKLNCQIELESQLAAVKQQLKDFTINGQINKNMEESINHSVNSSTLQGADNAQNLVGETTANTHKNYNYIKQWAEAFCSEMPYAHFKNKAYPWPWEWNWDSKETSFKNYRILSVTDNTAAVLYYAWDEESHMAVWRDDMVYKIEDGELDITQTVFSFSEKIDSARKFYQYYPNGEISDTLMDYANGNQLGEALNKTAVLSSTKKYLPLFAPDTAAIQLLNILENPKKVAVEQNPSDNGKEVFVTLRFIEDGSAISVRMIQPYGENGIWVPQTDETALIPLEYVTNSNTVLHSKRIASKLQEDAQRLETYFPDHHEQQKELVQSADLDGDGIDEEITMTNLMYNGGDGGYAISVKRNGTEIPMPQIYKEDTFPYFVKYNPSEALEGTDVVLEVYAGYNVICALTSDALYELYLQKGELSAYKQYTKNKGTKQTQNELGSIIYTIDANEKINGDAVSGFTVQTINGKQVLILKTYLSGILGHVDTLGYVLTYMTLNENDIWELRHEFLLEGDIFQSMLEDD